MRAEDIVQGKVSRGTAVSIEGRIAELLPLLAMGGQPYERFILDDGSAKVTVIIPASEKFLLPGDRVRLTARVRPCPYAPAMNCLESEPEEIELLEWKWIEPAHRRGEAVKGPFNIRFLLHMTRMDEEVMEGIISTGLDPLRIKEVFEERLEANEDLRDLTATLTAMTMYSVFLRDLSAANITRMTISLLTGLPLPDEVKLALIPLSDMLETLASREGLAPYISPPEELRGVVERYPVASEEELKEVPRLEGLARKILRDLNEGKRISILLEFSESKDLEEIRKMVQVVAGLSGSRLLMMTAQSLAEEMTDVIADLREMLSVKKGERVIVYIEAPELLFPNESMLDLLKVPAELKPNLMSIKAEIVKTLSELLERACLIAATVSGAMVDTQALRVATLISMEAGAIPSGGPDYSM